MTVAQVVGVPFARWSGRRLAGDTRSYSSPLWAPQQPWQSDCGYRTYNRPRLAWQAPERGRAAVHLAVASADPSDGGRVQRLVLHRPLLGQAGHYHGAMISMALLGFGVASVADSTLGGRLTDRCGAFPAVAAGLAALTLAMLAVSAATAASAGWPALVALAAWGLGGWTFPPSQQHRLVATAPGDASVVLGLNSSAIYAGAAIGGVIGGLVLPAGAAFVPTLAAGLAACALICAAAQHHYAPPATRYPAGSKAISEELDSAARASSGSAHSDRQYVADPSRLHSALSRLPNSNHASEGAYPASSSAPSSVTDARSASRNPSIRSPASAATCDAAATPAGEPPGATRLRECPTPGSGAASTQ